VWWCKGEKNKNKKRVYYFNIRYNNNNIIVSMLARDRSSVEGDNGRI